MFSHVKAVYRLIAVRYGTDGYPSKFQWRLHLLDEPTGQGQWEETVGNDRVVAAAHAGLVYVWGQSGVVNRIGAVPRPFGDGGIPVDSPSVPADSRLSALPRF
ncbi:hypothetical protein [Xylophilus sp. GOD-11R]|uniref:hypothetical protein n=1 Tax=Xylophilus sp. GOD-11R TaxID=3089814 RepID=UPI00298C904F|nr:hypothetical protein [Xylophilus sp. GOD-11R]WPB58600.1 hypothetical protein R9X41_08185 [Xylophilus sp. GOD-11R]